MRPSDRVIEEEITQTAFGSPPTGLRIGTEPVVRNWYGGASQEEQIMPDKTAYETGARKYPARTGPDPSDEFSQKATENRKPPSGVGITHATKKKSADNDKKS